MKPNLRSCLICRKVAPKPEFWRIVRIYPHHQIALDEGMGRSAYLCPNESCLRAAQKKNRLGKALKAAIPESVYGELMCRLVNDSVAKDEFKR